MRTAPIKAATTPPPVNGKVRQLRGNLRHTMTKDFKRSNQHPVTCGQREVHGRK